MNDVQDVINKLLVDDFDNQDLECYLESSLVLIKVNAIMAVLKRNINENNIIHKLNFISKNIKEEPKVLGEWTTGHYAMAVLNLLNTKETQKMYSANLKKVDIYTKESIEKLIEQIKYLII